MKTEISRLFSFYIGSYQSTTCFNHKKNVNLSMKTIIPSPLGLINRLSNFSLMKTFFTLTFIILFLNSATFSQDHKFQIGIDGGPSSTFIYGYELPLGEKLLTSMVGYSASATIQYNFSQKLALRTGIGFEQKGAQSTNKLSITR